MKLTCINSQFPIETGLKPVSINAGHNSIIATTTEQPKFRNKYRIESARLKHYDYSSDGAYFITICTKNREHYFGEIIDAKIKLSKIGKIVENEWTKTVEIRKNVVLDKWVIMPNHWHGIIFINNAMLDIIPESVETHCNASL